MLVNPTAQISRRYIEFTQTAAAARGLVYQTFQARSLDDLEPAFDAMAKSSVQALTINPDGVIYQGKAARENGYCARNGLGRLFSRNIRCRRDDGLWA